MTRPAPLVSVIVPSYNHATFVGACLASVLQQTHRNMQLIVVDDASQDGSQEVIKATPGVSPADVILKSNNEGLNSAIETGLGRARGQFIAVLSSDDLIEKNKVERQVEYLRGLDAAGVYSNGWQLHEDGRRVLIDARAVSHAFATGEALRFLYTCDTAGPYLQSGLFAADAFRGTSSIRKRFRSDDWAAALFLLERYRINFLDEPLFTYRLHEANSHKRYWSTFSMRTEVISQLTPADLRREAVAKLLGSQATYLSLDSKHRDAARFALSAAALDGTAGHLKLLAKLMLRPTARRLRPPRRGPA